MRKTLADARHAIERSKALIAQNEDLRATLAETLELCRHNHVAHELLRQDGDTLRQKTRKLIKVR